MHYIFVGNMKKNKVNPFEQDMIRQISTILCKNTCLCINICIIASWTLRLTLWGYPIRGIYQTNLS